MVQYKSTGLVLDFAHQPALAEPGATELIDFSRYKTNGTFRGAGQPDWVDTTHGLHVMEYATGDYVEVTCPQCNFTDGDFSVVMQVLVTSLAAERMLFSRGLGITDGYYSYVTAAGRIRFFTNQVAASQFSESADGAVLVDTHHTIGFSRSGASVLVYREGVDVTNIGGAHIDPVTSARTLKIGIADDLASRPFIGQIAPLIQEYSKALTAAEHLAIHNNWKGLVQ